MCRKIKAFFFLILALMITTSCQSPTFFDGDMDIYKKIHKKYVNMESYRALATLTVYSDKTKNEYSLEQFAKGSSLKKTIYFEKDGKECVEICENDDKVMILSPAGAPLDIAKNSGIDCLYANDFFALYYKSQTSATSVLNDEMAKTVLLETDIFPVTKNAKKAVMTIDEKANIESIKIYDMGGNLYMDLKYGEFEYNADLSDEIFNIRQ